MQEAVCSLLLFSQIDMCKVAGAVFEQILTIAFWFVSGSLACRNVGHSGHRKSPVE